MLRSELRLYRRGLVVVLVAVQMAVIVTSLLIGQTYARDQIDAAVVSTVNTCDELVAMEVPSDQCAFVQLQQRYSRSRLMELAARIGPPAEASTTIPGAGSLAVGHAATAVGLLGLVAVAAVVLGGEAASGVATARDRTLLGARAFGVRAAGLLVVWGATTLAAAIAVWAASWVADIELGWWGGSDHRATGRFLVLRAGGAWSTALVVVLPLVGLRRRLTSRTRWLVVGGGLVAAVLGLAATRSPFRPPTNAGLGLMRFEPHLLSFIDRLPADLVVVRPTVDSALVVLVAVFVLALSSAWAAWSTRCREAGRPS